MKAKMAKSAPQTLRLVYIIDDFHPLDNETNPVKKVSDWIMYTLKIKDYYKDMGYSVREVAKLANKSMRELPKDFLEHLDQIKFFVRREVTTETFQLISPLINHQLTSGTVSFNRECFKTSTAVDFIVERNMERANGSSLDTIAITILTPLKQMKIIKDALVEFEGIYQHDTAWQKLCFNIQILNSF